MREKRGRAQQCQQQRQLHALQIYLTKAQTHRATMQPTPFIPNSQVQKFKQQLYTIYIKIRIPNNIKLIKNSKECISLNSVYSNFSYLVPFLIFGKLKGRIIIYFEKFPNRVFRS